MTLETGIIYGFPYHIAVFLLNETIVIFPVRAATSKLDLVLGTPVKELVVNKLSPVITINAKHGEREGLMGMGDLFFDPAVGVYLGSTGKDVYDGQSLAELTRGVCATVADGVKLKEPRPLLAPVKADPDKDLAFQEGSRLGSVYTLQAIPAFLLLEFPVYGCGADGKQEYAYVFVQGILKNQEINHSLYEWG